ncbi:MAG TPA: hypothetical protein VIV12_26530 [Streptosporangiaceae bacterium]
MPKTKTIVFRLAKLEVRSEYSRYAMEVTAEHVYVELPSEEVQYNEEGQAVLSVAGATALLEKLASAVDDMHETRINKRARRSL